MSLAAVAKARGHEVKVAIGSDSEVLAVAKHVSPDVVGFSVTTGYQRRYLSLGQRLKDTLSNPPMIVFGGPHPTFFPAVVLEDGVDVVCRGEGEGPIEEILDAVDKRQPIDGILNLAFNRNGRLEMAPLRPLVDVDALPFPDREIYREYPIISRAGMATFMASRGCPYSCTFCFNSEMTNLTRGCGTWVRFRSPENLLSEIERVVSARKLRFIDFHDDIFTLRRKWLKEFLAGYAQRIGLPFSCQVRADLVTEEVAKDLKDSGCARVSFGLESGDETIRNEMLKKGVKDDHIRQAAAILRRTGIPFFTTNMMGLPGETLAQAFKTLELNIEIGTRCAWVSLFQPFPGTQLAQYCLDHGYLKHAISIDAPLEMHTGSPLEQPEIDEIVRLQKFAYVVVRFPKILPLVRKLVHLNLGCLYLVVHRKSYLLLYFRGLIKRRGARCSITHGKLSGNTDRLGGCQRHFLERFENAQAGTDYALS